MNLRNLLVIILLYLIVHNSRSEFVNLQVYASQHGQDSACEKANDYLQIEENLWIKSYYLSKSKGCFFKTDEFKELPLSKKRQLGENNVRALESMRLEAFRKGDIPPKEILNFVHVSGERLPEVYEYLEKLRIKNYLDSGCEVEEGDHDDCHSPFGFVKADFIEMIYYYKINDREKDVNRLYQEYLKHPYGGQAISSLKKDVDEMYQIHLKEQRAKSTNDSKSQKPVDPKKVTEKLQQAMDAYDEAKAKTHGVATKESKQEPEPSMLPAQKPDLNIQDMIREYGPFIAIIIVVGMYLRSRRK